MFEETAMNYGARQYQRAAATVVSPRGTEIAAFAAINARLTQATDGIDRIKALNRNHELWSVLLRDIALSSNPLPEILKKDLTELGIFSMRYSTAAINGGLPVTPLVEINDSMIEGLRMQIRPQDVSREAGAVLA
jgi:flagellar biosynthesis regulator FlaF